MLIGVTGRMHSGKTTISTYICEKYGFEEYAFAEALKLACSVIFAIDIDDFYSGDREVVNAFWGVTPRFIMQTIGTAFRELGKAYAPLKSIWIRRVEKCIANSTSNIVISDVRYPDEAQMILDHGGVIIAVTRATEVLSEHESETQKISANYTIDNNSSIKDLYARIDEIVASNLV